MRALPKVAWWTAALVLGVPLLLSLSVWLLGNLPPGRALIEHAVSVFSGGEVRISGLAGAFPDELRIARFELRDAHGVFASGENLQLRWAPLWLLARELRVSQLSAGTIDIERAPQRTARAARPAASPNRPLGGLRRIEIGDLQVRRLSIGAALAGSRAALAVSGRLQLRSLQQTQLTLSARALDGRGGSYRILARLDPKQVQVHVDLREPPAGVLESLLRLPRFGGLSVRASLEGPRAAVRTQLAASAGALRSSVQGTLDLVHRSAALQMSLTAPAMAPGPQLAWQRLALSGQWQGPLDAAVTDARLTVTGLRVRSGRLAGLQLGQGRIALHGRNGRLTLAGQLQALHLPGPDPQLLQGSPVQVTALVRLDQAGRPLSVTLAHPLLRARLHTHLSAPAGGALTVTVPRLQAFSALLRTPLQGSAQLEIQLSAHAGQSQLQLSGLIHERATATVAQLLSPSTHLSASALLQPGGVIRIEQAALKSARLQASLAGEERGGAWKLDWTLALPDLSVLAPGIAGRLALRGGISGSAPQLVLDARGSGVLGVRGQPPGPLRLHLSASGLPTRPSAALSLSGTLDASPVELAVSLAQGPHGAFRAQVRRGTWKSLSAAGQLALSPAGAARGTVTLSMSRLADLNALLARPVSGSATARFALEQVASRPELSVAIRAPQLALGAVSLRDARLDGTLAAPRRAPHVMLTLSAEAASAGAAAQLRVQAQGPPAALRWQLAATGTGRAQGAQLAASAQLDLPARRLTLRTLELHDRDMSWKLLSPAHISYAGGLRTDRLALAAGPARLTINGELAPALDLRASLTHFELAQLGALLLPGAALKGTMAAEARLNGTLARPTGELTVNAQGLAAPASLAGGVPATGLHARLALQGDIARLQARLDAGPGLQLQAQGQLPLARAGPLALTLSGHANLDLANSILAAGGQRLAGRCALDLRVGGTASAPQIAGMLQLTRADFQDYVRGVHWSDVSATLLGQGRTLRVDRFTARAGSGTVSASGQIGLLEPGMPVHLVLRARNAEALTSDLVSANVDMSLALTGRLRGALDLAGRIDVHHADVNIPNALPTSVAVLDVRRAGAPPAAPARPIASRLALMLTVAAPRAVFIRGRGLTAELGGQVQILGTAASPQIRGGFGLRSGNFNLAGTRLTFTRGQLSFNGTGLRHRLDPTLDFDATSSANGVNATLHVGGFADQPVISLSSSPPLPQDEILARLLFGESVTQLTGLQLAQIGAALATMTGVGGNGLDPLAALQRTLGLDRLAISGGRTSASAGQSASNYATIEVGRYVSSRVFVGARQSTAGTTQAQVQIDLTRQLKLQTTLSNGGGSLQGATPQNDPGSSIGLRYEVDY